MIVFVCETLVNCVLSLVFDQENWSEKWTKLRIVLGIDELWFKSWRVVLEELVGSRFVVSSIEGIRIEQERSKLRIFL